MPWLRYPSRKNWPHGHELHGFLLYTGGPALSRAGQSGHCEHPWAGAGAAEGPLLPLLMAVGSAALEGLRSWLQSVPCSQHSAGRSRSHTPAYGFICLMFFESQIPSALIHLLYGAMRPRLCLLSQAAAWCPNGFSELPADGVSIHRLQSVCIPLPTSPVTCPP